MLDTVKTTKLVLDKNERIAELEEENKNLKEMYDVYVSRALKLEQENIKLKEDLDKFSESFKRYRDFEKQELADSLYDMEEQNKKLKEERDFFKEQAILWRKDYKNEYEKNRKLEERIEELETDYDRLKVAFEDVVSGK